MRLEPLTVAHVERLRVQPAQAAAFARMSDPVYRAELLAAGPAWAASRGERVLALAGLSDHGGGRAQAWCFLGDDLRRDMVALVRAIRRTLDGSAFGRVELVTVPGWKPAADFARALGFEFEATMHGWLPPLVEGEARRAAYLWGRVR